MIKSGEGFIVISRKLLDWEWYSDTNTKLVFFHCLLKANWKDGRFQGHEVPRGTFITSYGKIAEELGISVKSVRTAISHLESTGEITRKVASKWQAITVVNYGKYQDYDSQEGKQVANKWQASGKQVATIEQRNKETRETIISISSDFDRFWSAYPKHQPSRAKALDSFKKAIKKTDIDTILQAIEEQKRSDQWRDSKYIPMATTWLNQERWDYEVPRKSEVRESEAERRARAWS